MKKPIFVLVVLLWLQGVFSLTNGQDLVSEQDVKSIIDSFSVSRMQNLSISRMWADSLLRLTQNAEPFLRGRGFKIAAIAEIDEGRYSSAIQYLRKAEKNIPKEKREVYYSLKQNLAAVYKLNDQLDSAFLIVSQTIEEVERDYPDGKVLFNLYSSLAEINHVTKRLDKSLPIYKMLLGKWGEVKDSSQIALTLMNLGTNYGDIGMIDSAVYYVNKAVEIADKAGMQPWYIRSLLNKAMFLQMLERHDEVISIVNGAIPSIINFDKKELIDAYAIQLESYLAMGKTKKAKDCVSFLLKLDWNSLTLSDYLYRNTKIATSLMKLEDWDGASHWYKENFELLIDSIKNDLFEIDRFLVFTKDYLTGLNSMASTSPFKREFGNQGKLKSKLLEWEDRYGEKIGTEDLLMKIHQCLAELYEMEGDYKGQAKYLGLSINAMYQKMKTGEEAQSRNISMLESIGKMEQEMAAKELHATKMKHSQERNKLLILFLSLATVALVVVVLLLKKADKLRMAKNGLLKERLVERNENIENIKSKNQKIIEQLEEKNKILLQKDLLKEKMEAVLNYIDKLTKDEVFGKTLRSSVPFRELKAEMEELEFQKDQTDPLLHHFMEIDHQFFERVNQRHSGLTKLDLKHMAYIKLLMSIKDVAQLLNVSDRTVETARYRLKKKLGLPKEVALAAYIREF